MSRINVGCISRSSLISRNSINTTINELTIGNYIEYMLLNRFNNNNTINIANANNNDNLVTNNSSSSKSVLLKVLRYFDKHNYDRVDV